MTTWVDLVARVRGLSTHLLTPAAVGELARAPDLRHLTASLAAVRGRPAPDPPPSAAVLEELERRHHGAQLRLLARWAGTRVRHLAPLYDEEDARSLRAMLRGVVTGTAAEERLAGLLPTPSIPPRALALLAEAASPATMAALLSTWGNAFGPVLLAEATRPQPDLLALEHALVAEWAAKSTKSTRWGARPLRTFVARQVDAANCWSALIAAGAGADRPPGDWFVEGGTLIERGAFQRAAAARGPAAALAVLGPLVRHTPLREVGSGARAGERVRRALLHEQRAFARVDPLGIAPVIVFWLQLRIEADTVRRLIWGVAAGAPAPERLLAGAEA